MQERYRTEVFYNSAVGSDQVLKFAMARVPGDYQMLSPSGSAIVCWMSVIEGGSRTSAMTGAAGVTVFSHPKHLSPD